MRARVKQDCHIPSIRSAGMIFGKDKWETVPAWAEREIANNPYLEVEPAQSEVDKKPDAQPEPEATDEPVAVDDKAAKMVVDKPARKRRTRKV